MTSRRLRSLATFLLAAGLLAGAALFQGTVTGSTDEYPPPTISDEAVVIERDDHASRAPSSGTPAEPVEAEPTFTG